MAYEFYWGFNFIKDSVYFCILKNNIDNFSYFLGLGYV